MICKIALASPLYQLFDYLPPLNVVCESVQLGSRVLVPFGIGNHKKIGVLVAITEHSDYTIAKLKRIERIIDTQSLLSAQDLSLLQWVSRYYHHPIGEVISMAFPKTLRQDNVVPTLKHNDLPAAEILQNAALSANPAQQTAIATIKVSLGQFAVFLLEGVTGSGKTEVYLQIIHTVLQRGQQVLMLVPEISLTPQLEARFRQRFNINIAILHSRLTDNQRQTAWLHTQQGHSAILLGTRSALFTPFHNLGLIILDEEHDSSFKQQDNLRFSARDSAIIRAKLHNIPIVLGSATPSLETLHNVAKQRYQWLHLPERAGNAIAPNIQLLDIRNQKLQEGLSEPLLAEMRNTLAKNEQVLLFLNRRGFAPTLICHNCGWVARCLHCAANLVFHAKLALLRCHHCGTEHRLIQHCPDCQSAELTPLGLGTERIEKILKKLFADKTTLRLDKDSTQRKGMLQDYLARIDQGKVDIILGTQLLAKGHHFPNVTLVAIIDVDSGLFSVDFHAAERLAQLIVQVSGRAGRADKRGTVLLQTRQPHHPLLTTLIRQGYQGFAQSALVERHTAGLPPYSYQVLVNAQARDEPLAQQFLRQVIHLAAQIPQASVQLLGPVPAPMAKRAGFYRYQLLLQSSQRADLHSLLDKLIPQVAKLKTVAKIRWSLDVDPVTLY
jgi:primosomal protein N' (replication factor Y) (superfamily II helicase)